MSGNLIILAGGISSRMKKSVLENNLPDEKLAEEAAYKSKTMLGVGKGDRPFLDYLLYNSFQAGYNDIVIVVNNKDEFIRDHYKNKIRLFQESGIKLSFAIQHIPPDRSKPLGTGDAVLQALQQRREWENKKFTVCNSDNLYSVDAMKTLLNSLHSNSLIDYDRTALGFENEKIMKFAVLQKDENNYLTNIIEKPSEEEMKKVRDANGRIGVSMNIFGFSYNDILPCLEKTPLHPVRHEKEIPEAVRLMINEKPKSVLTYPRSEFVPDLTEKNDINKVMEFLKKQEINISF